MIYQNNKYNLTTREMVDALHKAGLPVDPAQWTIEQGVQAAEVLDKAQAAKVARVVNNDTRFKRIRID